MPRRISLTLEGERNFVEVNEPLRGPRGRTAFLCPALGDSRSRRRGRQSARRSAASLFRVQERTAPPCVVVSRKRPMLRRGGCGSTACFPHNRRENGTILRCLEHLGAPHAK